MPLSSSFRLDPFDPALECEVVIVDLDGEMLGHLPAVQHGAGRQAISAALHSRECLRRTCGWDAGKLAFGGGQQFHPPRGQSPTWSHDHRHHQMAIPSRRRVLPPCSGSAGPARSGAASRATPPHGHAAASARPASPPARYRSPCRPSAAPSDHRSHNPAACSGWPVCAASFVAITLPQQHRRRRRPIGHRLDEPGRIGSHPGRFGNPYMDTKSAPISK